MLQRARTAVTPYAQLPLRLGIGLAMLVHGWAHVAHPEVLSRALTRADLPAGDMLAWVLAGIELIGGLLVLLGFQTRLAALVVALRCGLGAFVVSWGKGFFADDGGFEYPLLLMLGALCLWLGGAGRASVDSIRGKI